MTTLTDGDLRLVRLLVDRARRAQLARQGGYTAVERDARAQEKDLGASPVDRLARLERERDLLNKKLRAARKREARKAGEIVDLRVELRRVRNALYKTRCSREMWYTRATGHPPGQGRGASRTTLKAVA